MRTFTYDIRQDICPMSPCEWDNVGTFERCRNNEEDQRELMLQQIPMGVRKDIMKWADVSEDEDYYGDVYGPLADSLFDEWIAQNIVMIDTYMGNEWGVLFCTKERALQEWGEEDWRERAESCLESEAEMYAQYIDGEVYGYTIEDDQGIEVSSCWGFYGYDYCEEEAENELKAWQVREQEAQASAA